MIWVRPRGALDSSPFLKEGAADGAIVNALTIDVEGKLREGPELAGDKSDLEAITALKKALQPEDLTGTAVFLASRASDFVTGQIIYVDGGILAAL